MKNVPVTDMHIILIVRTVHHFIMQTIHIHQSLDVGYVPEKHSSLWELGGSEQLGPLVIH